MSAKYEIVNGHLVVYYRFKAIHVFDYKTKPKINLRDLTYFIIGKDSYNLSEEEFYEILGHVSIKNKSTVRYNYAYNIYREVDVITIDGYNELAKVYKPIRSMVRTDMKEIVGAILKAKKGE